MDVVPGSDNLWKVLEDLLSEEMIRTLCKKCAMKQISAIWDIAKADVKKV